MLGGGPDEAERVQHLGDEGWQLRRDKPGVSALPAPPPQEGTPKQRDRHSRAHTAGRSPAARPPARRPFSCRLTTVKLACSISSSKTRSGIRYSTMSLASCSPAWAKVKDKHTREPVAPHPSGPLTGQK